MDIYEMLEKGMTVDEIKAEVDKTAALYKEDQEAEKEKELAYAKEDLHDALVNFLDATGYVDTNFLSGEKFQKDLDTAIDNLCEELKIYSKLAEMFKDVESKTAAATPDDLKELAKMFF